eukprot:COSAG02_NODE_5824_length_4012_cov_59.380199_5_plen_60_part_00
MNLCLVSFLNFFTKNTYYSWYPRGPAAADKPGMGRFSLLVKNTVIEKRSVGIVLVLWMF